MVKSSDHYNPMGRHIPDGYRNTTAAHTYGALAVAYYRPSATRPLCQKHRCSNRRHSHAPLAGLYD